MGQNLLAVSVLASLTDLGSLSQARTKKNAISLDRGPAPALLRTRTVPVTGPSWALAPRVTQMPSSASTRPSLLPVVALAEGR